MIRARQVASSPFDVVKSRVMGQPLNPDGTGKLYGGMVDCFVKSSQAEGFMSLYNGFWPNFGRVVSSARKHAARAPCVGGGLAENTAGRVRASLTFAPRRCAQVPRVTIVFVVMEQLKKNFG